MTTPELIKALFDKKIDRRIEEVIKVDQTDEQIMRDEIDEYVVTDAIRSHYRNIFDAYADTRNKPHEGTAIWVSGFFGSGKSSFAKMLGLSIANRPVAGESAAARFAQRTGDDTIQVLLHNITENIPTHAVIFDVSTDRGIKSGNQTLTEIMYRLFLESLGYARDLDLSELEIALEEKGELRRFEDTYRQLFSKEWNTEKSKVAFALSEASRVLNVMDPATYPAADSWVRAIRNRTDVTPNTLNARCLSLIQRRKPGHTVLFVVDEVGQFVARDSQKMLDLQAIVRSGGKAGRGKIWYCVTSQEKLNEIVSGLDSKVVELAKLLDSFALQAHLESSDIAEVTSRRVLSKNAAGQATLGALYETHRGRLTEHTRLSADIKLPELSRPGFVDLYPLLPYQIDLIIQVVSGLRTQGGASKHVGGAARTIIKLAQQLLINPAVDLAEHEIGALVRLDQVYDLVEGNISSEVRTKIAEIPKRVGHPMAQAVAKVVCLLQYVKSVHRTAENVAAALHPSVGGDSQLAGVREALAQLEAAHQVRRGDDGYRIPTPAEDDWERTRAGMSPSPGDTHRLHAEVLTSFWQPQPAHMLLETKSFKAGLALHGREQVAGDMVFHLFLADEGATFEEQARELRSRSQVERKAVFWAVPLSDAIDREATEVFRSKTILARKQHESRGEDVQALLAEERVRQRRHTEELRRLLRAACLSGRIYFRGNDRSPGDKAVDVARTAAEVLGQVLPEVFDRFGEAAAKPSDVKAGTNALFTAENLRGLPAVFGTTGLDLLRDERGNTVFRVESDPLKEVLELIDARATYGDTASGKYLTEELGKEPYGWDFDCVRLFVLALMRGGAIEATSKGQTVDSITTSEARDTFNNNNLFRQASFRPKKGIEFEELLKAAEGYKDTFGGELRELTASAVAIELRKEVARHEDDVASAIALLVANRLPGSAALDGALGQMKAILRGSEESAIGTFNAGHRAIKDAIRRAGELTSSLTEVRLRDLQRASQTLSGLWPLLRQEPDLAEGLADQATQLQDLLGRENFFKDLALIDQLARAIEAEHHRRYTEALDARVSTYQRAFERLTKTPGWADLDEAQQRRLAEPFERGQDRDGPRVPLAQLRSERDACDGRLRSAIAEVRRILDGERVVSVNVGTFFAGGIETEEQLEAALEGIREECARLIGAGKKVIVQ